MFSIPLLIFLFWSKGWAFEGNGDKTSVVFVLRWRHSWVVLASVWQYLSWRRWAFSNPCHVSKPSYWLNSKWKRIDGGRKIWPEKIINLEIQKLEGPGELVKAAAKSLLNFLNQTFVSIGHALQMLGKKSEPVNRAWDTSYYFPRSPGSNFSSWLPKRYFRCLSVWR